jgi:hypothetical protein
MIFLQMVNGLRHYLVAAADAQTFLYSVILNETGPPLALIGIGGSAAPSGDADLDAAAPHIL